MNRTPKVLLFVGLFLVVSVLWPYDATIDSSDVVARPAPPPAFRFPAFDPPAYLFFRDDWGGADSLPIYGNDLTVLATTPQTLVFQAGKRILPGTEYLVFTHTITGPDKEPASASLTFRAANGAGWTVPLTGEVTRIRINEEMNDWSPDPDTRWSFTVSTSGPLVNLRPLRLDIERTTSPVPDLVEYDDVWAKERSVRIFDQHGTLTDARITSEAPSGLLVSTSGPGLGTTPADQPGLGRVPPRDVSELRVVLLYNSSSPKDVHYRPTLFFSGADREGDWEVQGMPPTLYDPEQVGGHVEWLLPVDPQMWDSPFDPQTRWDVLVNWRGDQTTLPVYMNGDYHFWIEVHRAAGT